MVFVDGKAARAEGVAAAVKFADGDAGGAVECAGEVADVLVAQLLLGDDADGLRGFLGGECHAGGARHRRHGVVARFFAADAAFVGADGDWCEGGAVGGKGAGSGGRSRSRKNPPPSSEAMTPAPSS